MIFEDIIPQQAEQEENAQDQSAHGRFDPGLSFSLEPDAMISCGQINTYWIRRFLGRVEELRSDDIADTVCNKHQGADYTSFREPGHIGADQTQRQGNVDGEHASQDQARESTTHVVQIQLPDQNHANHRGNSIHNHSGNPRGRNVSGHGG